MGWGGLVLTRLRQHVTRHEFNFVALGKHIRPLPGYRCLVDGSLGRFKNSRKQDAKSLCQRSSRNRFHSIFRQTPAKSFRHASHLQCCCVKPLFSEPGNKSFAASVGKGKGTAVRHWLLQNRPQKFLQIFLQNFPSTSLLWMATSTENRCEAVACRQCRTPCTSAGPGRSHVGTDIKKN